MIILKMLVATICVSLICTLLLQERALSIILGDFGYDRAYSGKYYSVISSPYVSWEVATKQDLGLDFSFLGDRFSGTIDYFHEKRDDVFQERNYLPWSVGVESSPWANIGKVKAYGFDGTSPTSRK